ncbi:hypothetical protein KVR01_001549 [Diaporthe batatas]|uniref:uncharacterized protein n=1 Tax=Diaporthe batatas TaxID=748121 RepID=UPI001D04DF0E|nr:uncharacterized protein KVR01_001549 [Diaporthe batatas]KAG8168800.1 hypothetical protein KVR01_001549 [Diaporthe batatas]
MDQSQIVTGNPVAVIGAGISGLAAAKRLAAEGFQVDVYDRQSQAGGLWNFSPDPKAPFASAVYGDLHTNFPRQLMELQDYPWTNQPLFMHHSLVQKYLEEYSRNIQKEFHRQIRFNFGTEVVRLYHESYAGGHWELTYQSSKATTGEKATRQYIFVVVAVGVYDQPFIPYYEGLSEWREVWKGSVSHSKSYRSPDDFEDKRVLIVGYQASGFDIANKIAAGTSGLWISSTRPIADALPQNAIPVTTVSHFDAAKRSVTFTDGQSVVFQRIIFCTGYQYHQPFIKKNSTADLPLFPSGLSIDHLHEHTIYVEQPTLAFLGIVRGAVPTFLVVQAQAAFVARSFAGHLRVLTRPRSEDTQHKLPYPLFMDYLLRLGSLCDRADKGRLWRVTPGNNPILRWTLELDLVRTKRGEIRGAFISHNDQMAGVWSATDTLHEYHGRFLTGSHQNIVALVPFLILNYGYKDDHDSDMTLPFEGWEEGFGRIIGKSIIYSTRMLSETLGPESNSVISRGSQKLFHLVRDRWSRWAGTRKWSETDQLEDWKKAFEKFSALRTRRLSSPVAPPHIPPYIPPYIPPCAPISRPARHSSPGCTGPQVFTVRSGFDGCQN